MKDKNINIDKAWDMLQARLQEDNLLSHGRTRYLSRWNFIKVAVLLTGIIIGGSALFYLSGWAFSRDSFILNNTEVNSTLVATLADGSTVYLTHGGSLSYPRHFQEDIREVSLTGEAMFEVSGNKERPFIIETPAAKVKVTGTVFNIKSSSDIENFELHVQEGTVEVTDKENRNRMVVHAGESVCLHKGIWQKKTAAEVDLYSLYTRKIQFKDEVLSKMVQIINRTSDTPIVLSNPEIGNRKLTVTFLDDSPESIAELICAALNLRQIKSQDTIYISNP